MAEVTRASEWKGRKGIPLDLPSGNTALVRRPGIEHFLRSGRIPNSLKNTIRSAMEGGKGQKLDEVLKSDEDILELFALIDRIVVEVVIEPSVEAVPLTEEGNPVPFSQREDQEALYIDEVDLEDKSFIFQFAMGGTKDLERFRNEQTLTLGNLQSGEDVDDSAE